MAQNKTKNRILSLLLALTMVIGMIPVTSITANAATAAINFNNTKSTGEISSPNGYSVYFQVSDGNTHYFQKVTFKNFDHDKVIFIKFGYSGGLFNIYHESIHVNNSWSYTFPLNVSNVVGSAQIGIGKLPSYQGNTLDAYILGNEVKHCLAVDSNGKYNCNAATFTCLKLSNPVWTWENDCSSATATFTVDGYTATFKATITSSVTSASDSCLVKDGVKYTATVNVNGKNYTSSKDGTGDAGPHSLTYSATGNVITETCKNNCGHSETATLNVNSSVSLGYTGSAIKPLKVDYSSGWQGGTLDIIYSNNTKIGTASGSITVGGAKATKTFNIVTGTMTGVTADNVSVPYDETPHSITVNAPSGATVTYKESEEGTYTSTNPSYTNKGVYTVYYKVAKENYNPVEGSATVTISQAENSWTTEPSIEDWTYGEIARTPNKGKSKFGTVTVEYKLANANDSEYSTTVPTNAGDYKVRFTVEGNENYTSLTKEIPFTIAKVKLTVTAKSDGKTYGSSDPKLEWDITSGSLVGSDTLTGISVTRDTGEDVKDDYKITVSQTEGANPNYDITFKKGVFIISKKTLGISWSNTTFTYDGTEKVPTATATGVVSGDKIELTVTGKQKNAGTQYVASVTGITGDKAGNYRLPEVVTTTFVINKAEQTAPSGLKSKNETVDGQADGTITGVTTAMEYRRETDTMYYAITGTEVTGLADGTYYVRYKADDNHNASPDTAVVISEGRKLTVTVPSTQTGYTVSVDKPKLNWQENVTLTFTLAEGYSKLNNFDVKVNGKSINLDNNGQYIVTKAEENITVTVEGVGDNTPPTAEITLGTNKWNQFFNNITFGLFFKDTQTVTIAAEDKGSGINKIYYYLSTTEMSLLDIERSGIENWTEYTDAFNINPQDECIIYVVAQDKSGNLKLVSSDKKIIVDSIAPTITGIANGETHYGDTTFTVADTHIDVVKVDGEKVTLTSDGQYTITADGKQHTVVATDKSGNSTEIKITVITIASLDDDIEDITSDNVKSSDKKAIEDVQSLVNSLLSSGKVFTQTEQSQLESMKANVEALLKKISDVASEMADIKAKVSTYKKLTVKSDDKAALNSLYTRINTLLNGNNLINAEIEEINNYKAIVMQLVDRIARIANTVADLTSKVNAYDKDTVKSTDKDTINALISDITDLLNGNNLNDTEKENLGKVKATAEELIKKIDDTAKEKQNLSGTVNGYDKDKVTSNDKQNLEDLIGDIEELLDGENLNDTEKEELSKVKETAEELLEQIENAGNSSKTENTDKVKDVTSDNVTTDDKKDLENAKSDLEKSLEDYKNNLTEDEIKEIEDEIESIENALEVIEKVENVEDIINKLPSNITKADADAIKEAEDAYNALSKYEQSVLDKDVKNKLDNARATLDKLNKADNSSTSPSTGDTGNIWMWFVLLFVSGGGLIGTTVCRRKKKYSAK